MAAVGPRMLEVATGEKIVPEELGGVSIQAAVTGQVDHVPARKHRCRML